VTIHSVFAIYNHLFTHLEKCTAQLTRKKVGWKKIMLAALSSAREKLSEYYGMTDHIGGDLYAIGTILAPQNKLEFFSTSDWEPEWRVRYRRSLEEYILPYEKRYSETRSTPARQILTGGISDVDMLITAATSLQPQTTAHDEISRYVGSSKLYFLLSYILLTNLCLHRHSADKPTNILEGSPVSIPYPCKPCPGHSHNSF
jgi:hypothetical protein